MMKKKKKKSAKKPEPSGVREMRAEYDFSSGVRGKHASRYKKGTNLVVIDPDVAEVFPDSESVNEALRALIPIVRGRRKSRSHKTGKS